MEHGQYRGTEKMWKCSKYIEKSYYVGEQGIYEEEHSQAASVLVSFRVRLVCPLSSVSQQGAVVTFGQVGQLLLLTSLTDGRGSGGAADCFYPSDFWSVSATATRLLPRLSHSSASPMTRHSPFRFLHLPTFSPCIDAEV